MNELAEIPTKLRSSLRKLPPKQQLFVYEYSKNFNATEAALKAGFSSKTAYSQGSRLLKKVEIKEAVEERIQEQIKKVGVTKQRVLTELARLAFSDNRKLYDADGRLKLPKDWDDETAAAVAGTETFEEFGGRGEDRKLNGYTRKVKTWDKTRALELLAKHLALITEKADPGDKPILIISAPNGQVNVITGP